MMINQNLVECYDPWSISGPTQLIAHPKLMPEKTFLKRKVLSTARQENYNLIAGETIEIQTDSLFQHVQVQTSWI